MGTIQEDLRQAGGFGAGLLKSNNPTLVDQVAVMATADGMTHVAANASKYMDLSNNILHETPFDGSVEVMEGKIVLKVSVAAPAVHLLTLASKEQNEWIV